jgi:hypothetical protein
VSKKPTFRAALVAGSAEGILVALNSWFAMLMVGAAHSHDRRVPAFGYLTIFWLGLALSCVMRVATYRYES